MSGIPDRHTVCPLTACRRSEEIEKGVDTVCAFLMVCLSNHSCLFLSPCFHVE